MMTLRATALLALCSPAATYVLAGVPATSQGASRANGRASLKALVDDYPVMLDATMMDGFAVSPQSLDFTMSAGVPEYLMVFLAAAITTGAMSASFEWLLADHSKDLC